MLVMPSSKTLGNDMNNFQLDQDIKTIILCAVIWVIAVIWMIALCRANDPDNLED